MVDSDLTRWGKWVETHDDHVKCESVDVIVCVVEYTYDNNFSYCEARQVEGSALWSAVANMSVDGKCVASETHYASDDGTAMTIAVRKMLKEADEVYRRGNGVGR